MKSRSKARPELAMLLALAACAGPEAALRGSAPNVGESGAPVPAGPRVSVPSLGPAHREPELVRAVHRVEPGQTLYSIGKLYGLSAAQLAQLNGLELATPLVVGQEFLLPGVTEASPPKVLVSTPERPGPTAPEEGAPPAERKDGSIVPQWVDRAFPDPPPASEAPRPAWVDSAFPEPIPARGTAASQPTRVEPSATTVYRDAPPAAAERADAAGARSRVARLERRPGAELAAPLQWPLRGVLYARFGKKGNDVHDGIDLAAPAGTPVRTAAAGTVLFAGPQRGYGLLAIVEHLGRLVTVYAHNRDLRVKVGQVVRQGQVIATVGESGKTSGPHLHFEVRLDGAPVDPLGYLGPVPAS